MDTPPPPVSKADRQGARPTRSWARFLAIALDEERSWRGAPLRMDTTRQRDAGAFPRNRQSPAGGSTRGSLLPRTSSGSAAHTRTSGSRAAPLRQKQQRAPRCPLPCNAQALQAHGGTPARVLSAGNAAARWDAAGGSTTKESPPRGARRRVFGAHPVHAPRGRRLRGDESPTICRAFGDAGGGTRTPDTRIVIPLPGRSRLGKAL
jgi:hypothetical protein